MTPLGLLLRYAVFLLTGSTLTLIAVAAVSNRRHHAAEMADALDCLYRAVEGSGPGVESQPVGLGKAMDRAREVLEL